MRDDPRVIGALERIALSLDRQTDRLFDRVELAAEGLNPGVAVPRQAFNVTMNSSSPLWVDVRAFERGDGRRYLRLMLMDGYGTIVWHTELQAMTLAEIKARF